MIKPLVAKSATNIKESSLWAAISQVPGTIPYSTWYHTYIDFPVPALMASASLREYTLTDRGTWLTFCPDNPQAAHEMFVEGKDHTEGFLPALEPWAPAAEAIRLPALDHDFYSSGRLIARGAAIHKKTIPLTSTNPMLLKD